MRNIDWCLFLALLTGGCVREVGEPFWDYRGAVSGTNLLGCECALEDSKRPFFVSDWDVLRQDGERVAMYFHEIKPPLTLLFALKAPAAGRVPGQRLDLRTADGSARAWLIRTPEEVFVRERDKLVPVPQGYIDRELLTALVEGAPGAPADGPDVFELMGDVSVAFDGDRVSEFRFDLRTAGPHPLYRGYIDFWIDFYDRRSRNDASSYAKEFRERLECLRRCAEHPRGEPARLKGKIRGGWLRSLGTLL